jgi:hypothetical protein
MNELRVCTKRGTGFAILAGLAASVVLTTGAYADGGDDPTTATVIPSIPYTDSGSTADKTNVSDEVCPYTGSTSPDAWYVYNNAAPIDIYAETCSSGYDTKLYIYDSSFGLVACNDDSCPGFMSELFNVSLGVGTYYVVVDGWGGDFGPYTLNIIVSEPCTECPPEGILEGEPVCGDDYVDAYNGGCNSTPEVFQSIACGDTICGESGAYLFAGLNYRDTDWFELFTEDAGDITWSGIAEFPFLIFIIDLNAGCAGLVILSSLSVGPCTEASITAFGAPAGRYSLWAGPSVFDGVACGSEYIATLDCGGEPCVVDCPPGSIDEGEGPCFDNYVDNYNGGCNSVGEPFQDIACDDTICGLTGTYLFNGLNYRDTDWFLYTATDAQTLTWSLVADMPILGFIIDLNAGCAGLLILTSGTANPCDTVIMSSAVGPGTYSLWAGPSVFAGFTCEQVYVATLNSDSQADCGGGTPCPEDTNNDGVVDILDLLKVLAEWGTADADADVNDDGIVDILDLLAVLAAWGPCP